MHDVTREEPLNVLVGLAARLALAHFIRKPQVRAFDFVADGVRVIDPPETRAHASKPHAVRGGKISIRKLELPIRSRGNRAVNHISAGMNHPTHSQAGAASASKAPAAQRAPQDPHPWPRFPGPPVLLLPRHCP